MEPIFFYGKHPDENKPYYIEYIKQMSEACDLVTSYAVEFMPEKYPEDFHYYHLRNPPLSGRDQTYLQYKYFLEPLRPLYYELLGKIQQRDIMKQYGY